MMLSWHAIVLSLSWIGSNALAPHPRGGARSGVSKLTTVVAPPPRHQQVPDPASLCDDDSHRPHPERIAWSRRGALRELYVWGSACASVVLLGPSSPVVARADDAAPSTTTSVDLISRMFNPDGSIKEGFASVARFRTVSIQWDDGASDESFVSNVDGSTVGATSPRIDGPVRITYQLPEKWASGNKGDELYFDRTEGVNAKACRRITVFRPAGPGNVSESQLEKASTIGIAKSLRVPTDLSLLETADLVSGRTTMKDGQRYFDFDMAVAPKTCDQSKEDLGLGFCPYESIYLLSATVLDGRLYVMAVESDKDEWKRANSDLKLVRNSFAVSRSSDDRNA